MRTTGVLWCTAFAGVLSAACGSVSSTGDGGSSSSGSSGSASGGLVDTGSNAAGEGGSSPPADGGEFCMSSGTQINHQTDGGCEGANAFGTCGGDLLAVDCICPHDEGLCVCQKNNKQIAMVSYDCTACQAVGDSWAACGFPPMQ